MELTKIPFSDIFDDKEASILSGFNLREHQANRIKIETPAKEYAFFDLFESRNPEWPYYSRSLQYFAPGRDASAMSVNAKEHIQAKLSDHLRRRFYDDLFNNKEENSILSATQKALFASLTRPFLHPFPLAEQYIGQLKMRGIHVAEAAFLLEWKRGDFSGMINPANDYIEAFLKDPEADFNSMPGIIPALYGSLQTMANGGSAASALEKIRKQYPENNPDRNRLEAVIAGWEGRKEDYLTHLEGIPAGMNHYDPVPFCFLPEFRELHPEDGYFLPMGRIDFIRALSDL